jgi:hypothetical protein
LIDLSFGDSCSAAAQALGYFAVLLIDLSIGNSCSAAAQA